jgi:hypothetical protein
MASPEGRTLGQPRSHPPLEAMAASGRIGAEERSTGWSIRGTSDASSGRQLPLCWSEQLREPAFQELSEFGYRLKLRNGIQCFECRSERIR